jgi:phosphinothricin acetyltransferase
MLSHIARLRDGQNELLAVFSFQFNSPKTDSSPLDITPFGPEISRHYSLRMLPPQIRPAIPSDAPAINEIYNYYVAHSTCTYQEEAETLDGRIAWINRHGPMHPVLVAETNGNVVGWVSISPFHARSAFRFTVENAVYVHPDHLHKGIGRQLMNELLAASKLAGHHCMIAVIDSSQHASIALHRSLGFVESGKLREVGLKFGRRLDLVYLQKML